MKFRHDEWAEWIEERCDGCGEYFAKHELSICSNRNCSSVVCYDCGDFGECILCQPGG